MPNSDRKRNPTGIAALGALVASAVALSACSIGFASQSPQSHFAFPNSNVIPIGEAEGSASKLCGILFINWGSPDADDQERATTEALQRAGGDILINVRTDARTFMVPMLFTICTTKVRGTAAKMEVGRQTLSAMNPGAAQPPAAAPAAPPPVQQAAPAPAPAAPGAPPPAAAPAPAPAVGGCTSDAQCKGNRICKDGQCVSP